VYTHYWTDQNPSEWYLTLWSDKRFKGPVFVDDVAMYSSKQEERSPDVKPVWSVTPRTMLIMCGATS
jgi:hypothetical protein